MMVDFLKTNWFQFEILCQTALAMFLGALIGLDRELSKKPAGLRTHILVAGASALIVKLTQIAVTTFKSEFATDLLRADPIRIFVAVITGISFLGAGTIIRQGTGNKIEGLTTAASLLFSAVIGMGVALSQYIISIGATILALFILLSLGKIEYWVSQRSNIKSKEN
ncbi:MAG: MgtC/SapB family protein [Ignavibacteriaceae bacterium]